MVSKQISKFVVISFLLIILGAAAYLDSSYVKNNDVSTFPINSSTDETDEATTSMTQIPVLEYKLVDTEESDGYLIEVYQEFEIYKDQSGNVIESIPTANYDYLKYKIE